MQVGHAGSYALDDGVLRALGDRLGRVQQRVERAARQKLGHDPVPQTRDEAARNTPSTCAAPEVGRRRDADQCDDVGMRRQIPVPVPPRSARKPTTASATRRAHHELGLLLKLLQLRRVLGRLGAALDVELFDRHFDAAVPALKHDAVRAATDFALELQLDDRNVVVLRRRGGGDRRRQRRRERLRLRARR